MGQQESLVQDGLVAVQDKLAQVQTCCGSRTLDKPRAYEVSAQCGRIVGKSGYVAIVQVDNAPQFALTFEGEQQMQNWMKWVRNIEFPGIGEPVSCSPQSVLPWEDANLERVIETVSLPPVAWTQRLRSFVALTNSQTGTAMKSNVTEQVPDEHQPVDNELP
eukprot:3819327-Amphidinium_carterae.1